VYDGDGNEIAGLTFDYSTMLGELQDNGGNTKTCMLIGDNNPATNNGMNVTELYVVASKYSPVIPEDVISLDQVGESRENKQCIGAVVNK